MSDQVDLLHNALQHRRSLLEALGQTPALRLFNGFWEGWPELAVDLYGHTLLIHAYAQNAEADQEAARLAVDFYTENLPGLLPSLSPGGLSVLVKERASSDLQRRHGLALDGPPPDTQVFEHGAWYALRLDRYLDAGLYLDTRSLRLWAQKNLSGALVLNTFAYTGSLGAAALAGGARRVVQTDLSAEFLSLAHETYRQNGWPVRKADFITGDFFSIVSRIKRQGALFDCVFLDPPFFSQTDKGEFDLNHDFDRLLNKVRPLVGDGGRLVAVNNAVFVSGQAFMEQLAHLTASGYIEIEDLIPAPLDFTGFNHSPLAPLPADPAPFNYSTKIVVLRVKRKDGLKAR